MGSTWDHYSLRTISSSSTPPTRIVRSQASDQLPAAISLPLPHRSDEDQSQGRGQVGPLLASFRIVAYRFSYDFFFEFEGLWPCSRERLGLYACWRWIGAGKRIWSVDCLVEAFFFLVVGVRWILSLVRSISRALRRYNVLHHRLSLWWFSFCRCILLH